MSEIGEIVQDVLVDVGKDQFLVPRAENCHGDETDVGVLGFRLLRQSEETRVKFAVGIQGVMRGKVGRRGLLLGRLLLRLLGLRGCCWRQDRPRGEMSIST